MRVENPCAGAHRDESGSGAPASPRATRVPGGAGGFDRADRPPPFLIYCTIEKCGVPQQGVAD